MTSRRAPSWLAILVLTGCAAPAPAPRAETPPAATGGPVDPAVAAEVGHGEQVPPSTDRGERLALSRAGSIWMMRPDASDPVQLTVRPLDAPDVDPAFAPGVSHPEPGGLSTREVLGLLSSLPVSPVGADIVELNPEKDVNLLTAHVAARLVKELAALMSSH